MLMVDGIVKKKIPVKKQADSIFPDEDLINLPLSILEARVYDLMGEDGDEAMEHLLKRRSRLLKPEDLKKYQHDYHQVRKQREYRLPIRFNLERDKDILEWLEPIENKSEAIKDAIREKIRGAR